MSEAEGLPGVGRVLVIIPTYNEAENIRLITERVRRAVPCVDILVTDDNSPDGTGRIADELAASDNHVFVLHRAGKEGLGAAYVAGFGWAKDKGYDVVVEMDADGSHAPEQLPRLLVALADADLVLGSRYVPGGRMQGVPWARRAISIVGNAAVRRVLGVPIGDLTSGFRAARADVFRAISLEEHGFGIQLEGTLKAYRAGFRCAEVPITLGVRKSGYSKMAYTRSFWLGYARLVIRLALAPRVIDLPASSLYAEVEDSQSRGATL